MRLPGLEICDITALDKEQSFHTVHDVAGFAITLFHRGCVGEHHAHLIGHVPECEDADDESRAFTQSVDIHPETLERERGEHGIQKNMPGDGCVNALHIKVMGVSGGESAVASRYRSLYICVQPG